MLKILVNVFDIFIFAVIMYQIFRLINNTRSVQMFRAILLFFIVTIVAGFVHLSVTEWFFKSLWTVSLIVLVVVFQPEIRSILAEIGKRRVYNLKFKITFKDELLKAVKFFSDYKIGALIVIERNTGLKEYIDTGVMLNANVSNELLRTIFMPKSALHDGAVIIQRNIIASAASLLPLSKAELDKTIGTRHRAAVGLSELSDALIIVVSEETGEISVARENRLTWHISYDEFEYLLSKIYDTNENYFRKWLLKFFKLSSFTRNFDQKVITFIVATVVWYYIKFIILAG
jgi:diadenylate cyclase